MQHRAPGCDPDDVRKYSKTGVRDILASAAAVDQVAREFMMRDSPRAELEVRLPRRPETIAVARHLVRHVLKALELSSQTIDEVELAVSEACTNSVQHARAGDEYDVVVAVDEFGCEILIADEGFGFNPAYTRTADADAPRGRGIMVMRAVTDEFEVRSAPGHPTVVRLWKNFERSQPNDGIGSFPREVGSALATTAGAFAGVVRAMGGSIG